MKVKKGIQLLIFYMNICNSPEIVLQGFGVYPAMS